MSRTEATGIRTVLSDRLLQFAADRAWQTREFEQRVVALPADSPAQVSMRATLGAARAWEAGLLWVAWRLAPRTRIGA